jgi:hypothetical protein
MLPFPICAWIVRHIVTRSYMNLRNVSELQKGPYIQKCVLPLAALL